MQDRKPQWMDAMEKLRAISIPAIVEKPGITRALEKCPLCYTKGKSRTLNMMDHFVTEHSGRMYDVGNRTSGEVFGRDFEYNELVRGLTMFPDALRKLSFYGGQAVIVDERKLFRGVANCTLRSCSRCGTSLFSKELCTAFGHEKRKCDEMTVSVAFTGRNLEQVLLERNSNAEFRLILNLTTSMKEHNMINDRMVCYAFVDPTIILTGKIDKITLMISTFDDLVVKWNPNVDYVWRMDTYWLGAELKDKGLEARFPQDIKVSQKNFVTIEKMPEERVPLREQKDKKLNITSREYANGVAEGRPEESGSPRVENHWRPYGDVKNTEVGKGVEDTQIGKVEGNDNMMKTTLDDESFRKNDKGRNTSPIGSVPSGQELGNSMVNRRQAGAGRRRNVSPT